MAGRHTSPRRYFRLELRRTTHFRLLQVAATLMKQGRRPSLDEVVEEALVSRATAYRYFPSIGALLAEASADMVTPEPAQLFAGSEPADPVARVAALRLMLATALQQGTRRERDAVLPLRQNRRTPLIEAALEPIRRQFKPSGYDMLGKALALVIGTEGMVVCKDVLQLSDAEAGKVKSWAIRALVEAAKK
jgi:AcrR family transcriptional regulator